MSSEEPHQTKSPFMPRSWCPSLPFLDMVSPSLQGRPLARNAGVSPVQRNANVVANQSRVLFQSLLDGVIELRPLRITEYIKVFRLPPPFAPRPAGG